MLLDGETRYVKLRRAVARELEDAFSRAWSPLVSMAECRGVALDGVAGAGGVEGWGRPLDGAIMAALEIESDGEDAVVMNAKRLNAEEVSISTHFR